MKKNNNYRFYLRNTKIDPGLKIGSKIIIDHKESEILHQLLKVFRVKTNQTIILFNEETQYKGENTKFIFEIIDIEKKRIILQLIEKEKLLDNLKYRNTLALCLPNKSNKLEFILEKAVELNIKQIALIKSEFSYYPHQLRLDRLNKILIEAAEQSEQIEIPKIAYYTSLKEYLEQENLPILLALERSNTLSPLDICINNDISILIGPEGGFSENEIKMLTKNQIQTISLGKSILRLETAAILLMGIVNLKSQN